MGPGKTDFLHLVFDCFSCGQCLERCSWASEPPTTEVVVPIVRVLTVIMGRPKQTLQPTARTSVCEFTLIA